MKQMDAKSLVRCPTQDLVSLRLAKNELTFNIMNYNSLLWLKT